MYMCISKYSHFFLFLPSVFINCYSTFSNRCTRRIIIIIIIINEKINVAFSRRTARTRNSHKKNTSRENVVSNSTEEEKNSHENDCSKSSVFSCRLNISNDGCDVSVAGKLFHTRAPVTAYMRLSMLALR